ncbi:hypothetical protein [Micropruina sp.]|uniref:hypothetical protein n=1 Tax=Micropruina sp. TaxID=2737536 RepID=UPI0039E2707A
MPQPTHPDAPPSRRTATWRSALAAVLIVLAGLLTPVAMISTSAKPTLTDTDVFVASFAPVIDEPAVQAYLTDQVSTLIEQQLGIEQLVGTVVSGLQSAVGDRPRLSAAVGLLEGPAIEGLRGTINRVTGEVIAADSFAGTWEQTLRISHTQLVGALNGDPATTAAITGQGLGIRLAPIIERVKAGLIDRGIAIASRIPAVDRTIVIVPSTQLTDLQRYYLLAMALAPWLPWLVVALAVGGVLVANSRSGATVGAALAVALGAGTVLGALSAARSLVPTLVPASVMPRDVVELLVTPLTSVLSDVALTLLTLGLTVALLAWYRGRSRTATRVRIALTRAGTALRRSRDRLGLDPGRFGGWLYTARGWVRAVAALLAAAHLWANRPLQPSTIIGTVAGLAAVLAILSVLWRTDPMPAKSAGGPSQPQVDQQSGS